jgi:hypothetical protein
MLTDENMRVTEPKWECYLQGAGRHDAFFLNAGVFWLTEQTYQHLEQLFGPNNLPVVAENAGSFC